MSAKIYSFRGEVHTALGWADTLDIPVRLIQLGLQHGLYLEDLIPANPWFQLLRAIMAEEGIESPIVTQVSQRTQTRQLSYKLYTYKGESKTLLEFMHQYGLSSVNAVRKRLLRGTPLEGKEVKKVIPEVKVAVKETGTVYEFRGKFLPVREIARRLGISPAAVRWRIAHEVALDTAVDKSKVHKRIPDKQEEVSNNNALAEFLDATATTHQGRIPDLEGVIKNA